MSKEESLTEDDVREEHLKEVNQSAHWGYMLTVLGGSMVIMLALIAFLGSTTG